MRIALAIAVFLLLLPAHAATGGKGKGKGFTTAPSPAHASTATGHGNSTLRTMRDPRRAPELDATRKVSEQDCTKPDDLDRGNLRCK